MEPFGTGISASQLQNLDPAAKLEVQQVIEEEARKIALQSSTLPRCFCDIILNLGRHPETSRSVNTHKPRLILIRCFKKCIGSKFGSNKFERGEEVCLQNCVDRFFDSHIFIVERFGPHFCIWENVDE